MTGAGPRRPRVDAPDAGLTLLEVMVSMALMLVVLAMFTTGVLQAYRTLNRTDAAAAAQTQVNIAFLRLDKEIRYAAGISKEGVDNLGYPSVEYLTTNTGATTCTGLRLNQVTGNLEVRSWAQGTLSPASDWTPMVSRVASVQFATTAADAVVNYRRLWIKATVTDGSVTPKEFNVTFTALNTTVVDPPTTETDTVCTERRGHS